MSRYINFQSPNASSSAGASTSNAPKRGGLFWSRSLAQGANTRSHSEQDNETSSDEEESGGRKVLATSGATSKSVWRTTTTTPADTSKASKLDNSSSQMSTDRGSHETLDSALIHTNNHSSLARLSSSSSEQQPHELHSKSLDKSSPSDTLSSGDNNKQRPSTAGSTDGGSSASTNTPANNESISVASPSVSSVSPHGVLELSLLHDESHHALHCTVHKAKVSSVLLMTSAVSPLPL